MSFIKQIWGIRMDDAGIESNFFHFKYSIILLQNQLLDFSKVVLSVGWSY